MKICPGCQFPFTGFEDVCLNCRNKGIVVSGGEVAMPASAVNEGEKLTGHPEADKINLVVGAPCPTCGRKVRPAPLSDTERKRRWRKKKK